MQSVAAFFALILVLGPASFAHIDALAGAGAGVRGIRADLEKQLAAMPAAEGLTPDKDRMPLDEGIKTQLPDQKNDETTPQNPRARARVRRPLPGARGG